MGSAAAAAVALGHILPGAADAAAAARCVHQGARPLSAVRTLAGRSACPPSRRPASRWGLRRRQPRSLSRWGTGGRREGGSGADLKVSGVRAEPRRRPPFGGRRRSPPDRPRAPSAAVRTIKSEVTASAAAAAPPPSLLPAGKRCQPACLRLSPRRREYRPSCRSGLPRRGVTTTAATAAGCPCSGGRRESGRERAAAAATAPSRATMQCVSDNAAQINQAGRMAGRKEQGGQAANSACSSAACGRRTRTDAPQCARLVPYCALRISSPAAPSVRPSARPPVRTFGGRLKRSTDGRTDGRSPDLRSSLPSFLRSAAVRSFVRVH